MLTSSCWQMHLLGGLHLQRGTEKITRFRSQKFGALLAYLALFPNRLHTREELADLLWPDADPDAARVNLRTALSSLRRQLEPPGDAAGSVLVTDGRTHVRLNAETIRTDVAAFEGALTAASRALSGSAADASVAACHLAAAVQQYGGPLLPGYYETWALTERDRLAEAHLRALGQLTDLMERGGDADQALDFARRAVSADPLREESHGAVIRLLMRSGQPAAAKRQFDELARLLKEQFDDEPSAEIRALLTLAPASPTPRARITPVPAAAAPAPEAPTAAAPQPAAAPPNPPTDSPIVPLHLPAALSRFFGREDEIEALRRLLVSEETHLITVTGPGGSGKTRIGIETAHGLVETYTGGIWFVPLADVLEAERLPEAVAAALGLPLGGKPGVPLWNLVADTLRAATARGRALLVLDNFEQLAETGAEPIAELLERVPLLVCLVTSRQRLRIQWEREFPLLPLPVPEYPGTPERLLEFSSVQLFVNRAQAARSDFQLTTRNAASVAALCAQLEGIPLAIELAAAWMGVLSASQMLARMTRRLDLLVSRRRDVSPRHRTLRAAIESSVALLTPEVQEFFTRLSVFRGGWTLEAAEAIADPDSSLFALDHLTTLCDHSLVVRVARSDDPNDADEGVLRFRMLETLREFAREALDTAAIAATVEQRHAAYFTTLVDTAVPLLSGVEQAEWLHRLDADHDNIRALLDFRESRGEITEALRLAGMLSGFWSLRGYPTEGRQRLTALLERAGEDAPAPIRARALAGAGKLAHIQSDYAVAHPCHEAALALYRAEGDMAGIAATLCELGNCEMQQSNYATASSLYEESLAGYRALGDRRYIALLLNNLGANALAKGLPAVARVYLEESLPLSRALGHHRFTSITLLNLATIWQAEGDFALARTYYEQSLAIRRELGDSAGIGRVLEGLARIAMEEGDAATALDRFDESLALRRRHDDRDGIASVCLYRGMTLVRLKNDLEAGADSLRESLTVSRRTGNKHFVSYALDGFASVAAARRQPERAVRLWSVARTLRDALGVTAKPRDAQELADEIAGVRALLGDAAFELAWASGRTMPLEEAIALALEEAPEGIFSYEERAAILAGV